MSANLILTNGRFTTLDARNPSAEAVAIAGGRFIAVGSAEEIEAHRDTRTRAIDLGGRRVIPGLIDSHTHVIRGGLSYNLELRWDGVRSLADAMAMLKRQVDRTPPPQWVRVVGGFTEHQFAEKRLPTLGELNTLAPDTPVFILHLYDRAKVVYGAEEFSGLGPSLPPAMPDWSPVRTFGGYQSSAPLQKHACAMHRHARALPPTLHDPNDFWGALGCSCWAF